MAITIYVSGPMAGIPDHNLPAFAQATERLDAAGYIVFNPGRFGEDPDLSWADCLRRDLFDLLVSEAVALLPGWENSRGANLEVHVAEALGMPVKPLDEWLRLAPASTKESA